MLQGLICLLALTSCSQNLGLRQSAEQVGGGNKAIASNATSDSIESEQPTSTGQESDIKEEISPELLTNGVLQERLRGLAPSKGHTSEILEIFMLNQAGLSLPDGSSAQALSIDKAGEALLWADGLKHAYQFISGGIHAEAAAFSAKSGFLAMLSGSNLYVYSSATGQRVASLDEIKTRVASICFQPGGMALLLGGVDGEVYRWRFLESARSARSHEDKHLERYFGHANVVSAVAYHPIGRVFFSGDWSGALNAWLPYDADRFSGFYDRNILETKVFSDKSVMVRSGRPSHAAVTSMAISADGENLVLVDQEGFLEWWSVRGFGLLGRLQAHKGVIYSLSLSPGGTHVLSVGRDGKTRLWALNQTFSADDGKRNFSMDKVSELAQVGLLNAQFLTEDRYLAGDKSGKIFELRF